MSSDSVDHAHDVRLTELVDRARCLTAERSLREKALAKAKQAVADLEAKDSLLTQSSSALRLLLDRMVLGQVAMLERMVTDGLRAVFHDQHLALTATSNQKYGKVSIDLALQHRKEDTMIQGDPLDSFGGGPACVTSLLIRLVALLKLKKEPFLLLDETLVAVSDDYVDATGRFLAKLSKATGISILVVTHKTAFQDHADQVYQGYEAVDEEGRWSLGLHVTHRR